MAILKITRMGHPVLRQVAQPVADPTDPEMTRLVRDMVETMEDAPGIGLAAPQVYVSRRIIVFKVPAHRATGAEHDRETRLTILVNPEIEPIGDEMVPGIEGCLSIPGLRGVVPRHARIRYRGYGLDGTLIEREAAGQHARVVQHEVDHLDGILYLDRMTDLRRLAFTDEAHHIEPIGPSAPERP